MLWVSDNLNCTLMIYWNDLFLIYALVLKYFFGKFYRFITELNLDILFNIYQIVLNWTLKFQFNIN